MRLQYFIPVSLFLLLFAGCADKAAPQGIGNDGFSIILGVAETLTKTSLGDKSGDVYPVFWANGDRVSLNGLLSGKLKDLTKESTTAHFNFVGQTASPYTVIYPGENNVTGSVVFQQHQTYVKGSVSTGSLPMTGTAETLDKLSLVHLGAVLRLPLRGSASVRGILLRAVAGEPLSGRYDINEGVIHAPETGGFVWLDVPSAVSLGSEATVFNIAVPAGVYAEGIRITVYDADGYYSVMISGSSGFTAESGTVYELEEIEFLPVSTSKACFVSEATDMKNQDYMVFLDDIDLAGCEWSTEGFSGVIEGLGHKIIGASVPLFGNVNGFIRGLHVESDISVDDLFEAGIISCVTNGGVIENCVSSGVLEISTPDISTISYFGGICGRNRGTVRNCVNYARIKGTAKICTASQSQHYGGVTGAGAGQILSDCVNRGEVSYEGISSKSVYVGGVTGRGTSGAVITGNKNYGAVSSSSSRNVGLIIGAVASGVTFEGNHDYSE